MTPRDYYKKYLEDIKLMQLATVNKDGTPWLCNVWYVIDDQDCVYWISRETRRHSQEIEATGKAAATFHMSYDKGLGQDGQALVISGAAKQLSGEECRKPYDLYAAHNPAILEFQSLDKFLNDEGHHYFYKITPKEIIWWDQFNFPDDPRQVVKG